MPDLFLLVASSAAAAVLAVVALLAAGWPWRRPRLPWAAAGGALGVGAGFLAGACLLGLAPHFPPREDRDRLLLLLVPAAVGVEVAAAFLRRLPWLVWSLRLTVAAAAAPVLLHGSIYLTDAAGPGTRVWSPAQAAAILGGLAAALAAAWALLDRLAAQGRGRGVLLILAVTVAGSGLTVMLSGYASGGQLGVPLAAELIGVAAASLVLGAGPDLRGAIGVAVVGLFSLLVVGRFFGDLTTTNSVLLFAAPLLGFLPELLPARRFGPRARAAARLALALLPVALVLTLAVQKFHADSAPPSAASGASEPSVEDYLNFGK
jgi:hypothetical protein